MCFLENKAHFLGFVTGITGVERRLEVTGACLRVFGDVRTFEGLFVSWCAECVCVGGIINLDLSLLSLFIFLDSLRNIITVP